ncbi:MAG: hypothetical protein E7616_03040 [Ruminococcaceae bacterium]|nr:hypothetical protein [Oscillospiraceae bacterium]
MVNTETTNGAVIRKMIANQAGMTFFGILVTMAGFSANKPGIVLAASLFTVFFYMYLLFYLSSELGKSDKIRVDAGRMQRDPWRCTILSLWANSLNIALAVLAIISKLFITNVPFTQPPAQGVTPAPAFAASICSVCETIYNLIHSMYIGILDYMGQRGNPLWLLIFIIPSIAACTLGYLYGLNKK